MKTFRVALVVGTRPEVIKLGPVYRELSRRAGFRPLVLATAQHRQMLDQMLPLFGMVPDLDLDIMQEGQTLGEVTCRALAGLEAAYEQLRPDIVLVQGDTTTVLTGSLAAFYARIPVGHVEAGLRTSNKFSPFPEEINRRLTGVLADLHLAATARARDNLLAEGVRRETIFVTGNTVIDALQMIAAQPPDLTGTPLEPFVDGNRRIILVTAHRRENLGEPLRRICRALRRIAESFADVQVIYAVHPNPQVRATAHEILDATERVALIDPPDYRHFVALMSRAYLALTDSGGVQEEAPGLDLPVLVARDTSERPEGIAVGAAELVGTNEQNIFEAIARLLTDPAAHTAMRQAPCPYGDGRAAARIADALEFYFGVRPAGPDDYMS